MTIYVRLAGTGPGPIKNRVGFGFKKKPEVGPGQVQILEKTQPKPNPTSLNLKKITKLPTYVCVCVCVCVCMCVTYIKPYWSPLSGETPTFLGLRWLLQSLICPSIKVFHYLYPFTLNLGLAHPWVGGSGLIASFPTQALWVYCNGPAFWRPWSLLVVCQIFVTSITSATWFAGGALPLTPFSSCAANSL